MKKSNLVVADKVLFTGKLVFFREQKKEDLPFYGMKGTYFRDMNGVLHDLLKVSFSSREFGSEDGELILPKPEIIDGNGTIEESGNPLLYSYINGNPDDIVIISSIYNIKLSHVDKQLRMGTDDIEAMRKRTTVRNSKSRYYIVNENGKGDLFVYLKGKGTGTGNIALKIMGTENNGNLKLELNGKLLLKQIDNEGNLISKIYLGDEKTVIEDKYQNRIELNGDGAIIETATLRLGKTETVAKIMKDLITEIRAMSQGTAAGGPTISPPFNDAKFAAIVSRISNFMEKQ